ncbi:hypothetical protein WA158_005095 [Blastocystis sp. Blastoise]
MIIVYITLLLLSSAFSQTFSCVPPRVPITLRRTYKSNSFQETVEIWEGNSDTGTRKFRMNGANQENSIQVVNLCLSPVLHTFVALDGNNDGWDDGSYFELRTTEGVSILQGTLDQYSRKEHLFYPAFSIISTDSWKYTSEPQVNSQWTSTSFIDTSWNSYSPGNFPTVTTITRYFRKTISMPQDKSIWALYEVGIWAQEGIILYINGNELYRRNLPLNGVSSSTIATSVDDTIAYRRVTDSLYSTSITSSSMTIAVELHTDALRQAKEEFKAFLIFIYGPCSGRSQDGLIQSDHPRDYPGEEMEMAFDDDIQTKWFFSSLPAYIDFTFSNGRRELINKYQVTCGNHVISRRPLSWILRATNDQSNWILLDYKTNIQFTMRRGGVAFPLTTNNVAYQTYRLEILTTEQGGDNGEIAEIEYYTCNTPYVSPTLSYSQQKYILVANMNTIHEYPTLNGFTDFSVSPSLPEGISLDINSGVLLGVPNTLSTLQSYTIRAKHFSDSTYKTCTLQFEIINCISPNIRFNIYKRTNNNGAGATESFSLLNSQSTVISTYSYQASDVDTEYANSYTFCLPEGIYTIQASSTNTKGWALGSYISVDMFDISHTNKYTISRFNLLNSISCSFQFIAQYNTPLSFKALLSTSTIQNTWKDLSYNDNTWITYSPSLDLSSSTGVWYFRASYLIQPPSIAHGFEFRYICRSGVALYLDGKEYFRYGVPSGDITPSMTSTFGSNSDDTFTWRSITGVMQNLQTGSHIFAIAVVHPPGYVTHIVDFDISLRIMADSNYNSRTWGMYVRTNSMAYTNTPGSNLIDQNYQTKASILLNENYIPPQPFLLAYHDWRAEAINKFCLVSAIDGIQDDPKSFTFEASQDDSTWELLTTLENVEFEQRSYRMCFYIPTQTKPYNLYRLNCIESNSYKQGGSYACALGEIELYTVDFSKVTVLPLTYSSTSITGYVNAKLTSIYPKTEYYHNFQITPSLPNGLYMSSGNGVIKGTPLSVSSATYTITALNPSGTTSTVTIIINIVLCELPRKFFSLEFTNMEESSQENGFKLYFGDSTLIESIDSFPRYLPQFYSSYCQPAGFFKLELYDYTNDGWGTGVVYIKNEENKIILRTSVFYGESPKTVRFNNLYLIDPSITEWKYISGVTSLASSWNTLSFNDDSWTIGKPGNFKNLKGVTQYYRKKFVITSLEVFSFYEMNVQSRAGIAIYLNGQLFFVNNLPSVYDSNTLATTEYTSAKTLTTSDSVQFGLLTVGENIFAAEIHRYSDNIEDTFDASLILLLDEMNRVLDGIVSTNIPGFQNEDWDERAIMAFDGSISTKYYGDTCGEDIYLDYAYNNNRKEYITKWSFTRANTDNRVPNHLRLFATNDGLNWKLLTNDYDLNFGSYNTPKGTYTISFFNDKAYNTYRVYMSSTSCTVGLEAADISFFSNRIHEYCKSIDNFPAAISGQYSHKLCPNYYSGSYKRLCTEEQFGDIIDNCVPRAPLPLVYSAKSFILRTKRKNTIPAPSIYAAEGIITIDPSLPEELSIDRTTGVISGKPKNDFSETDYTITITNPSGTANTLVTLSSIKATDLDGLTIGLIIIACIIIIVFIAVVVLVIFNRKKSTRKSHKELGKDKPTQTTPNKKNMKVRI